MKEQLCGLQLQKTIDLDSNAVDLAKANGALIDTR